tara:strand:- start:924 stop:1460 length:537 start_codon:yes stop_codon:yes gene_type:complete
MRFIKTKFRDLFIIKHNLYTDDRGYFKETFKKEKLEKLIDKKINFCQQNSVKSKKNVLRGLHFQKDPNGQSKLISVEQGKILDIAVDIRKDSETYGRYFSYILSQENHESLFIPKGFAHGYLTISETVLINYTVDNYYSPKNEMGISYDDKFLKIDWGVDHNRLIISKKDKKYEPFKW